MSVSKTVLYGLECAHAAPGPPTLVNGVLRCAWCQDDRKIDSVIIYEWKFTCTTKGCTAARWTGLSKQNAAIFAGRHMRTFPTHNPILEYTQNPEAVKTAQKMDEWNGRKKLCTEP